jgi:hypothetical protein
LGGRSRPARHLPELLIDDDPQCALSAIHAADFRDSTWVSDLLERFADYYFAAEVLAPEWPALSADNRLARYLDHCHINDIIGRTIDGVQDQIVERYSPWMEVVDAALGRLDEWLVLQMIARWRDEVWTLAVQRVELPDEAAREAQRREIEESVVSRGHLIRLDAVGMIRDMLDG